MVREMLGGGQHPVEPLAAGAGGGFAGPVSRRHDLVPSAPIQRAHFPLDLGIGDQEEAPPLHVTAARRAGARLEDFSDQLARHQSGFSRRIDRVVRIISNSSALSVAPGVICSVILSSARNCVFTSIIAPRLPVQASIGDRPAGRPVIANPLHISCCATTYRSRTGDRRTPRQTRDRPSSAPTRKTRSAHYEWTADHITLQDCDCLARRP